MVNFSYLSPHLALQFMVDVKIFSREICGMIYKISYSTIERVPEANKLLRKLYKVNDVEITRVGIKDQILVAKREK
jgi:hypothetical protein